MKAAGIAAIAIWTVAACGGAPDVPMPPLEDMEPLVRDTIVAQRRVVLGAPGSGAAWGLLGQIFEAHGLRDEALRCYREASLRASGDYRWRYYEASLARDDLARSLELAERAAEAAPASAPVLLLKASLEEELGHGERAAATYRAVIGIEPSAAIAELALGRLALGGGDPDRAIEHLERARELQPTAGAIHAALARAYLASGDRERASRSAARARELEPNVVYENPLVDAVVERGVSTRALQSRAASEERAGRLVSAESLHAKLIALHPDEGEMHYNFANFLERSGRPHEAESHYRRALELAPDDPSTLVNLGNLLASTSRREEGSALLRRAVELAPTDAVALVGLSSALAQQGEIADAESLLVRVLTAQPDHLQALQGLSQIRAARGDVDGSRIAIDRAMAAHPDDGRTRFLAALNAARRGAGREAFAHVDEAERLGFTVPPDFVASLRESFGAPR